MLTQTEIEAQAGKVVAYEYLDLVDFASCVHKCSHIGTDDKLDCDVWQVVFKDGTEVILFQARFLFR